MFDTLKSKILLGVYAFLILSIPVGAYLANETQIFRSRASEPKTNIFPDQNKIASTSATQSAAKTLLENSQSTAITMASSDQASPSPDTSSPTIATSFGPTLSLKVNTQGRPQDNQTTKLFVGIVEGQLTSNPKFVLSFTVNTNKDGSYTNLSLAGLTVGSQYTALLKGDSQIATSSAFTMSPTVSNLNNGQAINMLSGDLNQDNVVNSADFQIAQKALGSNPNSANWNPLVDFNLDGLINSFDLSVIRNNLGQVGSSGAWISPIPAAATSSASLNTPPSVGGPNENPGHWMWVP